MTHHRIPANLAVSESGFVFMPSTGETFTLNPIGKLVLGFLQQEKSEDEIIAEITREYDVDRVTFQRDLHDFLSQLRQFNLMAAA